MLEIVAGVWGVSVAVICLFMKGAKECTEALARKIRMSHDPHCPKCPLGRADEIDYSLNGTTVYRCDTCGTIFGLLKDSETGEETPVIVNT